MWDVPVDEIVNTLIRKLTPEELPGDVLNLVEYWKSLTLYCRIKFTGKRRE